MSNSLTVEFYTHTGKKMRFSVLRAKADLTETQVRSIMDDLIATGAVESKHGMASGISGATMVNIAKTVLV